MSPIRSAPIKAAEMSSHNGAPSEVSDMRMVVRHRDLKEIVASIKEYLDSYNLNLKKTEKGIDLIGSLCHKYETSEDDVKKMMEKANELIADILKLKPCLASECENESLQNIDTAGLMYLEDLLEDSSLLSNISMLEKDYDSAICNKGDIDERVFSNDDDSLIGSGSLSAGAVSISSSKRKFDAMSSPTKTIASPLSPCRSPNGVLVASQKMAATKVSTAMTTAK